MVNDSHYSRPGRPWCSVIIPTLNEATTLPTTLAALASAADAGRIEVIVSDGGSTDATVPIARRYGCTLVHGTCGRAAQLNAGADRAKGRFVWFLHADTTPPPGWLDCLLRAGELRAPASFSVRFDTGVTSRWLTLFSWMSTWNVVAFRFGDQSLFLPQELFERIGGYREDMHLLEDNDIVRRATAAAGRFRLMEGFVTTSARRYRTHGVIWTQTVYVFLYAMYRWGASQAKLCRVYDWAFSDDSK